MTRFKTLIFSFCTLCIVYVCVELFSAFAYYALNGTWWSPSNIAQQRNDVISALAPVAQPGAEKDNKDFSYQNRFAPHPYLGYSYDVNPQTLKKFPLLTPYGFLSEQDPIKASADPNIAIVGITGGSVSEHLFMSDAARLVLHGYLQKIPAFHNKKVIIASLGMGGYAQPQEFFSVAYYYFQGGRLNLLINLDGHNEVTYPTTDSYPRKRYPVYPLFWRIFFSSRVDPQALASLGDVMLWKRIRTAMAEGFGALPYSPTAGLLWKEFDQHVEARAINAEQSVENIETAKRPYFLFGPDTMNNISMEQMENFAVKQWLEGHRQLSYLAKSNGFDYLHFLQPSPHLPGSKILTAAEKENVAKKREFAAPISKLYPVLNAHISDMQKNGEPVYSLTAMYENTKEQVYSDGCCHLNSQGNIMLAHAIGRQILQYYLGASSSEGAPDHL